MRGNNIISQIIFYNVTSFVVLGILITFFMSLGGISGKIIIEKSYAKEYLQASEELAQCKLELSDLQPICPKVVCKNPTGIIFAIVGFMFYVGSLLQIGIYNRKNNNETKVKNKK